MPKIEAGSESPFNPETWQQALSLWDEGSPVTTIEMGGIGPGYEQSIHIGVFELMRQTGKSLESGEVLEDLDGYLHKNLMEVLSGWNLGLTGSQASAIQHLAHAYVTKGYRSTIESFPTERRIIISTWWPTKKKSSGDD